MVLKIAQRATIPPFFVMEVMRAAYARERAGGDVLHLEVGQPSTAAPPAVLEAARRALEVDRLGYTEALGIPPLRAAIADWYRASYGLAVDPARVVVSTGSSGAFLLAFLTAFTAGDRVALAVPGYPAYRNILQSLDIEPVLLPVGPETRYQPTAAMLAALGGRPLDGLIVASPANPTGTMLDATAWAELATCCRERGIRLIADEIYHGITYDAPAVSVLAADPEAIVINSFSKYFSMTGWRLGWLVLPEDLLRPVECLAQNLFISPPTLAQHAALAVFDDIAPLEANVARYAANRNLLLAELPKAGFTTFAPADGAFYLYTDVAHLTDDSEAFCRRILAETGVAITPGIDFDPQRGRRTVRFSFAGATETMAEAARRLVRFANG